ncbi:M48 family metallopeptidase [Rhodococcus fascians]|nr:M48 family metallopeptidase [Rhodococcus fascians]
MSTANAYLTVRGIEVNIVYKDIKNLHIGVYPPLGRVRVAAPERFDDDKVRLAVIQRLGWIKRQQAELQAAPRQSEREMTTGESHYVWGVRKRLKVVERAGRTHLELDGERLVLYVPAGTEADKRRDHLEQWYREQLRQALPGFVNSWEGKLGVNVPKWSIRRMKTKWGSCNRETHHIWFNIELSKKHPDCLEYIVVHEMMHYFERNHGMKFAALMDQHLPDWRSRRDQLNASMLGAEVW